MFTDCPSCERLFRIRAAQLKAADGWVRCGYCAETFYALDRLYDAPVKSHPPVLPPEEAAPGLPSAGAETEQAVEQTARQQEQPLPADTGEEQAARQQEQPTPEDTGEEQPAAPDRQIHGQDEITAGQRDATGNTTAEVVEDRAALDELPPVLAGYDDGTARSYSRVIWSGLVVILLLIALAQLAWFNRDWLLREYPQLTPWAEKFCDRLQCDLIRFRDISAIKLVSRDVRSHPRYRNALLVSATIVNHAPLIQPYPGIELVIYDTSGQVISRGSFTADEYIEPGSNPAAGMPPGVEVHLDLELAGTLPQAAGFEFRFH